MTNLLPTAEIAVDVLLAMLQNPNVDVTSKDLPAIAVNHANNILGNLNERSDGKNH